MSERVGLVVFLPMGIVRGLLHCTSSLCWIQLANMHFWEHTSWIVVHVQHGGSCYSVFRWGEGLVPYLGSVVAKRQPWSDLPPQKRAPTSLDLEVLWSNILISKLFLFVKYSWLEHLFQTVNISIWRLWILLKNVLREHWTVWRYWLCLYWQNKVRIRIWVNQGCPGMDVFLFEE